MTFAIPTVAKERGVTAPTAPRSAYFPEPKSTMTRIGQLATGDVASFILRGL